MEMKKIKVETVYGNEYMREPNISEYDTMEEAEQFVKTCRKWGIGIASCEIIEPKPNEDN